MPPVVPYPPELDPPNVLGGPPTFGGRDEDACAGAELTVRPGWEKASLSEEVEQRLPIVMAPIGRVGLRLRGCEGGAKEAGRRLKR